MISSDWTKDFYANMNPQQRVILKWQLQADLGNRFVHQKVKEVQNVFNQLKRVSFNLKIKLHNEDGDNTDELEGKYSTKLRDKLLSHILNCRV